MADKAPTKKAPRGRGPSTPPPRTPLVKCDRYCLSVLLGLALLAVGLLLLDPLGLGPLAGLPFHAEDIHVAPFSASAGYRDPQDRLVNATLVFRKEFFGPESLLFDAAGHGPYASLSDGRVVRRGLNGSGWDTVATTSPSWNATLCGYDPPPAMPWPKLGREPQCGRPLGLRMHPITGDLLVADAYFGLFLVPRLRGEGEGAPCDPGHQGQGGSAAPSGASEEDAPGGSASPKTCSATGPAAFGAPRLLADSAEGARFKFTNDLDVDAKDEHGAVYFTDTSTKYGRRNFLVAILEGGRHGRLLRHDLSTGATTVLVRSLAFPNGVALSRDRSFLVFCETTLMRCHKYFLRGHRAGTFETFIDLPGFPDNIRLNPRGRFWIAIHGRRHKFTDFVMARKWLRALILRVLPDIKLVYLLAIGKPHGMILEVDEGGAVTQVLEDRGGRVVMAVSEVEEHGGKLWMGSVIMPHMAVLDWKA